MSNRLSEQDISMLLHLVSSNVSPAVAGMASEIATLKVEHAKLIAENEWLKRRISEEQERIHG